MWLSGQRSANRFDVAARHQEGFELKLHSGLTVGDDFLLRLPILGPATPALEHGGGFKERTEAPITVAQITKHPGVLVAGPKVELLGIAQSDDQRALIDLVLAVVCLGHRAVCEL